MTRHKYVEVIQREIMRAIGNRKLDESEKQKLEQLKWLSLR